MSTLLYLLPVAAVSGMVMGVSQSREFSRGLLRGTVNSVMIVGGMVVLALLVALAEDPTMLR